MVGGAADGVREDSVIFADAGDVGPEVGLKILRDGFPIRPCHRQRLRVKRRSLVLKMMWRVCCV